MAMAMAMEDVEAPSFSLGFDEEAAPHPADDPAPAPAPAAPPSFIVVPADDADDDHDDDFSAFESPWQNPKNKVLECLGRSSSNGGGSSSSNSSSSSSRSRRGSSPLMDKATDDGKASKQGLPFQAKTGASESKGSMQGKNGSTQKKNGAFVCVSSSSKKTNGGVVKGNTLQSLWKNLNGKVSGGVSSDCDMAKESVQEHDDDASSRKLQESRSIHTVSMDGRKGFCGGFEDENVACLEESSFDPPTFSLTGEDDAFCKRLFSAETPVSKPNSFGKQGREESSFDPPRSSITGEAVNLVDLFEETDLNQNHGHLKGNKNPSPSTCKEKVETGIPSSHRNEIEEEKERQQQDQCSMEAAASDRNDAGDISGKNGVNPLQSFWKSLRSEKSNLHRSNEFTEDIEEIEDYSSEDDFDMRKQSAADIVGSRSIKKPSLFQNLAVQSTPNSVQSGHHNHISRQNSYTTSHCNDASGCNDFSFTSGALPNLSRNSCINTNTDQRSPIFLKENSVGQKRAWENLKSSTLSTSSPNNLRNMPYDFNATSGAAGSSHYLHNVSSQPYLQGNWHIDDERENNDDDLFFAEDNIGSFDQNTRGSFKASTSNVTARDPRILCLLQQRFPHFIPVSVLRERNGFGREQVYIDYEGQFAEGKNTSAPNLTSFVQPNARRSAGKSSAKRSPKKTAQKLQKTAIIDNESWINTGNRNQNNVRSRNRGKQNFKQYGNEESDAVDTGHWITERTGKRIYITRDGKRLSGSSAYKQHKKDSGKCFKKTKRRRPRGRKRS